MCDGGTRRRVGGCARVPVRPPCWPPHVGWHHLGCPCGAAVNLLTILFVLGLAPWRSGLADVPVRFEAEAPYAGAMGLACDPAFRGVPGNAQSWCGDFEGIVVYTPHVTDLTTLLNILRHEDYHLAAGVGAGSDPFDEAGAYRAGCAYSYVDACPRWLINHP